MKTVCIFCGSRTSGNTNLQSFIKEIASELVIRNIELVYGGASIGVMGFVAEEWLRNGGKAHGVMPSLLVAKEVSHKALTTFTETKNMHDRKRKMYDLADIFLVLPGGFGTFDELCEVLTWKQIGKHHKPVLICNVDGYFDAFLAQSKRMLDDGYISSEHYHNLFDVVCNIEEFSKYLEKIS